MQVRMELWLANVDKTLAGPRINQRTGESATHHCRMLRMDGVLVAVQYIHTLHTAPNPRIPSRRRSHDSCGTYRVQVRARAVPHTIAWGPLLCSAVSSGVSYAMACQLYNYNCFWARHGGLTK